ncbi:uncharacterized protein LOC124146577 [Haliotis rufescens]|uniref:uncharacterized protein LOC124146577 n=1 Tax=Haliotis rufescens TaxID=6454 RepID=UPI00201EE6FE|nr:uncharacterized protein LOC124146577 [Haliotis rufescens]
MTTALSLGMISSLSVLLVTTEAIKYMYPLTKYMDPPASQPHLYPGGPGLPFPELNYLCRGKDGVMFLLPWACTGYVRCVGDSAYWSRCPMDTRTVTGLQEPICLMDSTECKKQEKVRWNEFCRLTARGRYPSILSCASFYDCSGGAEGVERECPYPNLYNPASGLCEDFRSAEIYCNGRPVPRAPCDYQALNITCSDPHCLPCSELRPSCVRKPDGNHALPNRINYPWYLRCERERTMGVLKCAAGMFFSSFCSRCIPYGSTTC